MVSFPSLLGCALAASSCALARTVRFAIEVHWETGAPDGYSRDFISVNGTSPGPALVVEQGDDIEFCIHNGLDQSTTVHFHGIEQLGTPWSDGVPGLSQKPIPAGGDWLYRWTATDYGTYWYHSHYQGQRSDGFFGPIHIRPRRGEPRPFDGITTDPVQLSALLAAEQNPRLVMISDWQHVTSDQFLQIEQASNIDVYCAQSILFNGKGRVNCLGVTDQYAALAPVFQAIYAGPLNGTWMSPSGCLPFVPFTQQFPQINPSAVPQEITGCQATDSPQEDFKVDARMQWASFNFINTASIIAPIISLDQHDMWVYAIDGRYIEPYKVQGIQVYSGERYSVMIRLDQEPGIYTLRANNFALYQFISGFATVTYMEGLDVVDDGTGMIGNGHWEVDILGGAQHDQFGGRSGDQGRHSDSLDITLRRQDNPSNSPFFTYGGMPTSPRTTILLNSTSHNPSINPFPNVPPSTTVSPQTHIFHLSRVQKPYLWSANNNISYPTFPSEYAETAPLLYNPTSAAATNADLVVHTGANGTWIDLVFIVPDTFGPPHPMHKHGNKAYIIGEGLGPFPYSSVAEAAAAEPGSFNFENPILRDGFTTLPQNGKPVWLAVRYQSVNPGAWLLHCHVQSHLMGGMAIAMLDGVEEFPQIPAEYMEGEGNGL